MSKSAWGNIGAWAEEAERADAEEREAASKSKATASSPGFPSLKESVTTAKQKKKTKMSLQEFAMQHTGNSGSSASNRLTADEILSLPTGPKQRSAEDMRSGRLGGGFSNYGSRIGSATYNTNRPREFESRRSYGGYEEDERKGMSSLSRDSEFSQPSRADEVDNWASMKKPTVLQNVRPATRPSGMYSSLGGGGGPVIPSRADEVDNWASLKAPPLQTNQQDNYWSATISTQPNRLARNSQSISSVYTKPESDHWRRSEQILVSDASKNESEVVEKLVKTNPFGAARPREDVLAEKGLDWKKMDSETDDKKLQPMSSQSSKPESSHSSITEGPFPSATITEAIEKPKPKANPFGDAKPREVLLEEKGIDWRKIDLDLDRRGIDRTETDEEKKMKEDIVNLRNELLEKSGEEKVSLHDRLAQGERNLEDLVRKLDAKVHYNQKTFDRPSSGSSRSSGLTERPPSAPGPRGGYADRPSSHSGRQSGFHERPHSRSGSYEDTRNIYPVEPHNVYNNERARPHYDGSSSSENTSYGRRYYEGNGRRGNRETNSSGSRW